MGATLGAMTEIRELKTEITGLRTDLKRFVERANQQHVDTVLGVIKKDTPGCSQITRLVLRRLIYLPGWWTAVQCRRPVMGFLWNF